MATSGKVSGNFNNANFKIEARWYAISQNIASNYTTVKVESWLYAGSRINVSAKALSIVFDSTTFNLTTPAINVSGGSWLKLGEATRNIYHNADGKREFDFYTALTIGSVSGLGNVGSASALGHGVLNSIAKSSYLSSPPSYTMFNSLPINITRASSNFTHEARIWVGVAGQAELIKTVSNITTSASVQMSLIDNTTIMRKLNGAYSVPIDVVLVTYNNGVEIGYTQNIGVITAPNRNMTSWSGNFATGGSINGVITKGWNTENLTSTIQLIFEGQAFTMVDKTPNIVWSYDTSAIEGQLYTIAGNRSSIDGTIRIRTYYNDIQVGGYIESYITAYMSNAKPIFNGANIYYKDVSPSVVAITGDNKYIVQGKSSVQIVIPIEDLATGQKGATIQEYTATLSGQKITKPNTGNEVKFDFGLIHASSNQTLSVKARDSRGLETEITKTVSVISYAPPVSNVKALRRNGFEETTTLSVSGTISIVNVGGVGANAIHNIQYRWKAHDGAFTDWLNFTRQTSLNAFTVTPVDLTFNETKSYVVEFGIQDKFGFYITQRIVSEGVPIFFIDSDRKSVGVNKFPENGSLDVKGDAYIEGDLYIAGGVKDGIRTIELGEYTDLNTLNNKSDIGEYSCDNILKSQTITNKPLNSNTAFSLKIEGHAGVKQTLTEWTNDNTAKMYMRNYYSYGGWSEWRKVLVQEGSGYTALSLVNGWTNNYAGFIIAGYRKDEAGFVHLRGAIKDGVTTNWTTIATLPVGFRPLGNESFAVANGTASGISAIDVNSNGNITLRANGSSYVQFLSGISFYVGDVS